jgi:DNA-binding SARP family transcriptional activator
MGVLSLATSGDPQEMPAGGGSAQDETDTSSLRLLGEFELAADDRPVSVGWNGQRVLAFLALHHGPVRRDFLARALWPDIPEHRLHACLRSVLWRLRRCAPDAVEASASELRLGRQIAVDLRISIGVSQQLIDRSTSVSPEQLSRAMRVNLHDDLLPTWVDEDWITADRERFHQLRLHSLEMMCERLTAVGWHGAAVDAGYSSMSADPFRESARRVLINAYLAEGNIHLAIAEYNSYRQLIRSELKCEPSQELRDMVRIGSSDPATRIGLPACETDTSEDRIRAESRSRSPAPVDDVSKPFSGGVQRLIAAGEEKHPGSERSGGGVTKISPRGDADGDRPLAESAPFQLGPSTHLG